MNKININNWKEFNLCDLFDVCLSSDDLQPGKLNDGEYPLISSGKTNNGIAMYIEKQEKANIFKGNSITIDMFGKCFYQEKDYYCVSHGRVNILIPKFSINRNIGLYIACLIEKSILDKYSFTVMCSSSLLKKEKIKLPVNDMNEPDWVYMERYMEKKERIARLSLQMLKSCHNKPNICETTEWASFKIGDIFEIKRPAARSQANYEEGDIPFVASGNYNNGIIKYLKPKLGEVLDKGNCISVSPVDGSAFYQKKDFLGRGGAGSSIILLYNDNINENNGCFIASIIRKVCSKYMYGDMGNKESIKNEIIMLPAIDDNNPDYEFMSQYIIERKDNIAKKLKNLNSI
ncbi:MAG: restriction endonuclease subunit S [Bacilli bacterium]|nr:restriction endonuclease subunit S [Bacilli bacterium]